MPKDGKKKSEGGNFTLKVKEFKKLSTQDWRNFSAAVAALVAKQIAERRARKKKKKKKNADKKRKKNE